VIPAAAFSPDPPTPSEREAFHTLRAALTYFNVDQPRRSIVVASPGKGDGKTTVAIQLAIASARAGGDVILIDADLRHPQIASRLGPRREKGLPSLLAGNGTLEEFLVPYEPEPALINGRLRVLAGSEVPPNPAQLLASRRMHDLLQQLPSAADMVIVDTSPALMVADSFPLFKAASGVLVVARLNSTYKAAIQRLAWTIRHAGGTVLGTVATAAETRGPSGRYDYVYGLPPTSPLAVGNGVPVAVEAGGSGRLGRLLRRNGRHAERQPEETGSPK
jgi:non-specific protein-tyrosine kinase